MKKIIQAGWPHLVIIISFLALTALFFSPALKGYVLKAGDTTHFQGMSKEIKDYRAMYGDEPLWTDAMFGGMPAYQISVEYPGNVLQYIDKVIHLGLPNPLSFLFLYLLGFYILLLTLRVNPWLAAVGAVAFALSSYYLIILVAGHNTKAHAIGYLPPLLAGILLTYRGKMWLGGSLTALFAALELEANHVQITYYFAMVAALVVIAQFVRLLKRQELSAFFKSSAVILLAAFLAVLCNANNLWNTYKYTPYTTRGKSQLTITPNGDSNAGNVTNGLNRDYVTQWSYGLGESWSLLIPNAKGGASDAIGRDPALLDKAPAQVRQQLAQSNKYWGDQPFTSGPVYVGAAVLLLFLLGCFYVKGPLKWALLIATILTIALAWGKNFMGLTNFFLDYVPGYNKFRAVTIILSLTELLIPLLAFIFLRKLWNNRDLIAKEPKPFYIITGTVLGLLLLFAMFPEAFFSFVSAREKEMLLPRLTGNDQQAVFISRYLDGLKTIRESIFRSDVWRSFFFVGMSGVMVLLFSRKKLTKPVFTAGLFLLIIIDLWSVDRRYLNNDKEQGHYTMWEQKSKDVVAYQPSKADNDILNMEVSRRPMLKDSIKNWEAKYRKDYMEAHNGLKKPTADQLTEAQFEALRFNTHFRVLKLGNTFQDPGPSYFFQSIGGYHGAKLEHYQDLIDFYLSDEIQRMSKDLQSQNSMAGVKAVFDSLNVLNMLNTRYIIFDDNSTPLLNPSAYGPCWFVGNVKWAQDADEEITDLGKIVPSQTAVINSKFKDDLNGFSPQVDSTAYIQLNDYKPNRLLYTSNAAKPQLAVFSEIYYPDGWHAYIDGKPATHFGVDYVLRGMIIPAGKHQIEFRFEPASFHEASLVSTISGVALILIIIFGFIQSYRKREQDTPLVEQEIPTKE